MKPRTKKLRKAFSKVRAALVTQKGGSRSTLAHVLRFKKKRMGSRKMRDRLIQNTESQRSRSTRRN